MYKVYGIYNEGDPTPLYIGATQGSLDLRFRAHLNHRQQGVHPTEAKRCEMMRRHRAGEVKLSIKVISVHDSRDQMLDAEYEQLMNVRPVLNTAIPSRSSMEEKPDRLARIEIRIPDQAQRVLDARNALKEGARRKGMKLAPYCLAILEDHIANNP